MLLPEKSSKSRRILRITIKDNNTATNVQRKWLMTTTQGLRSLCIKKEKRYLKRLIRCGYISYAHFPSHMFLNQSTQTMFSRCVLVIQDNNPYSCFTWQHRRSSFINCVLNKTTLAFNSNYSNIYFAVYLQHTSGCG